MTRRWWHRSIRSEVVSIADCVIRFDADGFVADGEIVSPAAEAKMGAVPGFVRVPVVAPAQAVEAPVSLTPNTAPETVEAPPPAPVEPKESTAADAATQPANPAPTGRKRKPA